MSGMVVRIAGPALPVVHAASGADQACKEQERDK